MSQWRSCDDAMPNAARYFLKSRCVIVAMNVTSISKPTKASIAATNACGSPGLNRSGKKPRP